MPHSKPVKSAAKAEKPAPKKPAKAVAHKPEPKAPAAKAAPEAAGKGKGNGEAKAAAEHKKVANGVDSAPKKAEKVTLTPFLEKQKDRLLALRDNILDSMNGVAKDTLRSRAEGSEASAFGMHQADAGSDAYDRDFALSLISQEQDALYEIEEALKRLESGTYGVCEMSGKPIAHPRLEAIPFARYTVECQAQIEKMNKVQRSRTPVTSLFGLTDAEEAAENEEEESSSESKE
jgi:RNA polymerase-binding transcription factor DksA